MKLLVCGSRKWTNETLLNEILNKVNAIFNVSLLIEGECDGADKLSRLWAKSKNIPVKPFPADWKKYGRSAGPIRNSEMLKENPDLVVAFHNDFKNSKGTRDMLEKTVCAGIDVYLVSEKETRPMLFHADEKSLALFNVLKNYQE